MALKQRNGFTLTELMMVVAILGIVMALGPRMMLQINRFIFMSRTKMELQREARSAMSIMNRNLRQATYTSIKIDRLAGQPYYSRITFTKKQGTVICYYQNGKDLMQLTGTQSRKLTDALRYLAFTFPRSDEMTIISVAMTLEKATYEGRVKALHMASEKIRVMNE